MIHWYVYKRMQIMILEKEGKPESLEIALIHRQRMFARHLILTECQPPQEETLERENHLLNPESHG